MTHRAPTIVSNSNGAPTPPSSPDGSPKGQRQARPGTDGKPVLAQRRPPVGWVMLIVLVLLALLVTQTFTSQRQEVTWKEFTNLVQEGSVEDVIVRGTVIEATRTDDPTDTAGTQSIEVQISSESKEAYITELNELAAAYEGFDFKERTPGMLQQLLMSMLFFLPFILIAIVIWVFIIRAARNAGGGPGGMIGSFGKSRHRVLQRESTNVTFNDVAGIQDAKDEVTEIVEFLKNPKRFMRLGGRIPRGVLLVGQPGCGKTMLAKAIAGEADVPFFSISGSDFVEMFVGVGASRVRDLFKQAKDSAPCIIFLDEIDAVGRKRGSGYSTGGHDEREQTLNAILVEMDGFESSDQVIVIAATNRADVLDPALTRPGRFDRQVDVPLPDAKGRLEILRVHAKKVKMGDDVSLETIARGTPMFSGAELAAIINEAAIIATMRDKDSIDHSDLEEARDKVRYGRSMKSRRLEEKERIATAYHEAGHAVLQKLLPDADPLHKVTIIPRGQSLGATMSLPEKDRYGFGARMLLATMRMVCGGRIAEKKKTDDVSSGAAMDIQQLTKMARAMVLEWGMSDKLGFVRYATDEQGMFPEREYSEETAALIDQEVKRFADEAYREAEQLLEEHWDSVIAVAEALLKHETLTADEVDRLMKGESLDKPTVSDLLAAEAAKNKPPAPKPQPRTDEGDELGPGVVPSPA
ncbi:MAG: ATP-dependent zinc metalloprotease FtsH [Phycisphaerales bacterium]